MLSMLVVLLLPEQGLFVNWGRKPFSMKTDFIIFRELVPLPDGLHRCWSASPEPRACWGSLRRRGTEAQKLWKEVPKYGRRLIGEGMEASEKFPASRITKQLIILRVCHANFQPCTQVESVVWWTPCTSSPTFNPESIHSWFCFFHSHTCAPTPSPQWITLFISKLNVLR